MDDTYRYAISTTDDRGASVVGASNIQDQTRPYQTSRPRASLWHACPGQSWLPSSAACPNFCALTPSFASRRLKSWCYLIGGIIPPSSFPVAPFLFRAFKHSAFELSDLQLSLHPAIFAFSRLDLNRGARSLTASTLSTTKTIPSRFLELVALCYRWSFVVFTSYTWDFCWVLPSSHYIAPPHRLYHGFPTSASSPFSSSV